MQIIINNDVATKLKYYTQLANGEISGLGKSAINEDGDIVLTQIKLFKQTCSSSNTDIDDEALAKFMIELNEANESPKDWNVWWHTHDTMGVFWSITDDTTIKNHSQNMDYLISIVTNKDNEYKGRVDIFPSNNSPFKIEMKPITIDTEILLLVDAEEQEQKEEKIKKLTETKDKITQQIKDLDNILFDDPEMEKICKTEIEEKVKKEITVYNGNYGCQILNKQEEYEDALDELALCYNQNIYEDDYYNQDYYDKDENSFFCPKCQRLREYCICNDNDFECEAEGGYAPNYQRQKIIV